MHMARTSSSYQLQCRYASRMRLVENAPHERIFAYIQSGFARTKPHVNCFVHRYCFVFENLIVSSESLFEILEKFFECLETRNLILYSRKLRGSRIKFRVKTVNLPLSGTVIGGVPERKRT